MIPTPERVTDKVEHMIITQHSLSAIEDDNETLSLASIGFLVYSLTSIRTSTF